MTRENDWTQGDPRASREQIESESAVNQERTGADREQTESGQKSLSSDDRLYCAQLKLYHDETACS